MLKIKRADTYLRTAMWPTVPREKTTELLVRYTHHIPDNRIDAVFLDKQHASKGLLGIGFHYVVKLDGVVEVARHPLTVGAIGRSAAFKMHSIQIGVVGGEDRETGHFANTLTSAQREALEELYQRLADALGVPLEIDEKLTSNASVQHVQDEASEAELEEILDRTEAASMNAQ